MAIYAPKKQCHKLEVLNFIESVLGVVKHQVSSDFPVDLNVQHLDSGRIQFVLSQNQGFSQNRSTPEDIRSAKNLIIEKLGLYGYSINKSYPLILKLTKSGKAMLNDQHGKLLEQQQSGKALSSIQFLVSQKDLGTSIYKFCFIENTISTLQNESLLHVIRPVSECCLELQHLFSLSKFGHYNCLFISTFFKNHFLKIVGEIKEEYSDSLKPVSIKRPTAFKANLVVRDEPYDLLYLGGSNLTLKHSYNGKALSIHECFKKSGFSALNNSYLTADKEVLVQSLKNSLFHYCKITFPKFYFKDLIVHPGPSRNYSEIVLLREFSGVSYWISFKPSSITVRNQYGERIDPNFIFTAEEFDILSRMIKLNFGLDKPTMINILAEAFGIELINANNLSFIRNLYFIPRD